MTKPKLEQVTRQLTDEEKARHAQIREQVMQEFPPTEKKHLPVGTGIVAELRRVRKTRGLTYEAIAHDAGLPTANTVKDVEYGRNSDLCIIESIAKALGLRLELIEA